MSVNVEQTRDDKFAFRFDSIGRRPRDAGSNRCDSSLKSRHVPNSVQTGRRIDDSSPFDEEIVFVGCRGKSGNT
jgi:hypothetical protein